MEIEKDILEMTLEELRQAHQNIRLAIRDDWRAVGHELCWYKPELWKHDPLFVTTNPVVPPICEFLERCAEYRKSLDHV